MALIGNDSHLNASDDPFTWYVGSDDYDGPLLGSAPPTREMMEISVAVSVNKTVKVNATSNVTITSLVYRNVTVSRLCGFPAVCSQEAYDACANTTLGACAECSEAKTGIYVFFVVLLGLSCLLGNVLVMAVLKKLGLRQGFNKMKFSLAVADFLTGVQLLVVSIYNISWSMNVTSAELDRRQLAFRGSPQATAGGLFLLLTFISSLYHLVFIGAQRLYAIQWPLRYRMQPENRVVVGLVLVWTLALTASTFPAWFPEHLSYCYQHTIFLFYVTEINVMKNDANYTYIIIIMIIMLVIPYVAMSLMSFATIFAIRSKVKKSGDLKGKRNDKSEVKMFVILALMQLGFTITIIPVVLANALFYGNVLDCNNVSPAYLVCFYLSMTNSVVNVIIYSFRDKAFAKVARQLLSPVICLERTKVRHKTSVSRVTERTNA